MTPLETLAKYGLKSDAQSIGYRVEMDSYHADLIGQLHIPSNEMLCDVGWDKLNHARNICRSADLSLLCSLAEKGKRLATVQEDIGIILRATIGDLCNENHFDTAREIENKLDSINKIITEAEGEGK